MDNVNLYLRKTDGTTLRSSQSFYDNKERVYRSGVGGLAVKLELQGYTVTSDGEGCGTNSMRVWITMLAEDEARDDANGPGWNMSTCSGVDTL